MLYAALLGFGLFFAGWGIVFVVSLAYAPTQLDAECQTTISKLAYKLALPDQALAEHIRGLLAQISENGKKVLRLTLLYEVIETDTSWVSRNTETTALHDSGAAKPCHGILILSRESRYGKYIVTLICYGFSLGELADYLVRGSPQFPRARSSTKGPCRSGVT